MTNKEWTAMQQRLLDANRAENDRWGVFYTDLLKEVLSELSRADAKHGRMAEMVEGRDTLKCEVMELEREINRKNHDPAAMRKEAVQVAAMAIKFLRDCC